tara:strand:+ start:6016 stop:6924 length:909 start_codon:yes stop_codon:yes gene_type:complete
MKFSLVFENSGDSIPFTVVENLDLFIFFTKKINAESKNIFGNNSKLSTVIDKGLNDINWSLAKTNEVLHLLINQSFEQQDKLTDYLDQDFLNKTHAEWVFSQQKLVNIDAMRFSNHSEIAAIGNKLHDAYPDEIRIIKIAEAMSKLGYIYPYEEVNLSVHRLEQCFKKDNLEFSGKDKWEVFDNPFKDTIVSNSNIVNFSFGYTYVGRQLYNKYEYFDTDLKYNDHYNYETLEYSFQLSLSKPQTIPFSKEFLTWCHVHNVRPITTQIPLANIIDLEKNLFEYRKILYRNSKQNNQASIINH